MYCKYEASVAYKTTRECIVEDDDYIYPPQREVVEIHKQLLISNFCQGLGTCTP